MVDLLQPRGMKCRIGLEGCMAANPDETDEVCVSLSSSKVFGQLNKNLLFSVCGIGMGLLFHKIDNTDLPWLSIGCNNTSEGMGIRNGMLWLQMNSTDGPQG